jgi:hypothetical protein
VGNLPNSSLSRLASLRKRVCLTYRVKIIQWLFIRKWRDNVVPNGRRIACSFVLEEINLLYHWRHGHAMRDGENRASIELSMIVKNGACTLRRCLDSVAGAIDRIFIGDTDRRTKVPRSPRHMVGQLSPSDGLHGSYSP